MDPTNKYELCRLCLQNSQSLVDIFEGNVEHGFTIKDAIEDLMQFQVTQVRGVPWMASSRCLVKLNDFRLFKIQCIDSNLAFETKFSRNDLDDRSDRCHTTFEVKFGRNSLNNDLHNNSVLDSFGARLDMPENHIHQELYPEVILKTMDEQDCLDETPTTSCNYPVVDSSSGSYVNSTKDFDRLESKASKASLGGIMIRKRIRRARKKKSLQPMEVPSFLSSEVMNLYIVSSVLIDTRMKLLIPPEDLEIAGTQQKETSVT